MLMYLDTTDLFRVEIFKTFATRKLSELLN